MQCKVCGKEAPIDIRVFAFSREIQRVCERYNTLYGFTPHNSLINALKWLALHDCTGKTERKKNDAVASLCATQLNWYLENIVSGLLASILRLIVSDDTPSAHLRSCIIKNWGLPESCGRTYSVEASLKQSIERCKKKGDTLYYTVISGNSGTSNKIPISIVPTHAAMLIERLKTQIASKLPNQSSQIVTEDGDTCKARITSLHAFMSDTKTTEQRVQRSLYDIMKQIADALIDFHSELAKRAVLTFSIRETDLAIIAASGQATQESFAAAKRRNLDEYFDNDYVFDVMSVLKDHRKASPVIPST